MKLVYGDRAAREVSERLAAPVADFTALKAIPADRRVDGMIALKSDDGSRWRFHSTSALTGDDLLVAAPAAGSGRWLRMPGAFELKMPIAFGTADAAILLTVPTGALLSFEEFFWQITADFTGGSSSAIGVSSSNKNDAADFRTKGDLLGGATGDVAATLVASSGSYARGTIGADWDSLAKRRTLWVPVETLRFDRITSAFTAGAGFVVATGNLLRNAGA
jgi:hypothetical protein